MVSGLTQIPGYLAHLQLQNKPALTPFERELKLCTGKGPSRIILCTKFLSSRKVSLVIEDQVSTDVLASFLHLWGCSPIQCLLLAKVQRTVKKVCTAVV